jgi:hypothetical protein
MNRSIFFLIAISFIGKIGYSQQLAHADSLSVKRAQSIINADLYNETLNNDYLLFSIADKWYLVIVRSHNSYSEYYLKSDTSNQKMTIKKVIKNRRILSKAFNEKLYQSGYITFNSSFYKNNNVESDGNITYFYLMKNGIKYGEARLSVFIAPNPINQKVYNFLLFSLLRFTTDGSPPG